MLFPHIVLVVSLPVMLLHSFAVVCHLDCLGFSVGRLCLEVVIYGHSELFVVVLSLSKSSCGYAFEL